MTKQTTTSSLSHALRLYRTEQAYTRAVPPSSVFSNALLRRIVLSRPSTLSELSKLNGIGQTRRLHYGRDIVRLVNLQAKQNNNNQNKAEKTPVRGAKRTQRNALKGAKSKKPIIISPIPSKTFDNPAQSIVVSRFFENKLDNNKLNNNKLENNENELIFKLEKKISIKPAKTSVYVLELEDGRVYVGSSKDVPRRLAQHSSGSGSAYTRVYPPTGVQLPRLGNVQGDGDAAERDETLRYMMQRGVPFVRGWKFARVDMPEEEYEEAEANIRELFDLCRRCGYKGHFCTQCRATYDRMGTPL